MDINESMLLLDEALIADGERHSTRGAARGKKRLPHGARQGQTVGVLRVRDEQMRLPCTARRFTTI